MVKLSTNSFLNIVKQTKIQAKFNQNTLPETYNPMPFDQHYNCWNVKNAIHKWKPALLLYCYDYYYYSLPKTTFIEQTAKEERKLRSPRHTLTIEQILINTCLKSTVETDKCRHRKKIKEIGSDWWQFISDRTSKGGGFRQTSRMRRPPIAVRSFPKQNRWPGRIY